MEIERMLDRVVVIDNAREEMEDLVRILRGYDVSVDDPILTDDYTQLPIYTKNRQLIFMDLMLDEDEGHLTTNISRVISILSHIVGEGFGPYGLVLWTKHLEKMNQMLARLDTASNQTSSGGHDGLADEEEIMVGVQLPNPPAFVIGIDKVQFKSTGAWDFSGLLPILNQEIQKSNATYFFLCWLAVTRQASLDTITSVYGLTHSYAKNEAEISYILYRLALNHTGINHYYPGLITDSYKAFSDVLHPKINALVSSELLPNLSGVQSAYTTDEELLVLAQLNSILFFDNIGIDQNEIVPGYIYEVIDTNSPVIVNQEERLSFMRKNDQNTWEDYKTYPCTPIAIELTPPCDFSNKKVLSRIVGGYIVDYSANNHRKKELIAGDKGYILKPICLPNERTVKCIIFDFRHLYSPTETELKDPMRYRVLFRANHALFSDILQRFSSHAARLGLKRLELI
ncbi:MAG: hypothetical protein J5382_03955 [Bacteroidales bacterium]|nr:hypothetical protein [Bacteroidales bacterium]